MINRPNLMIYEVEEAKIQTKVLEKLFNEIIAENFPTRGENVEIQVQEAFRILNVYDQKTFVSATI
jgi:hypothetical protein